MQAIKQIYKYEVTIKSIYCNDCENTYENLQEEHDLIKERLTISKY